MGDNDDVNNKRVILGNLVEPIQNSYDQEEGMKSFVDRYYTVKYALDVSGESKNDYRVLIHHNKVCVITLAPSHPIIAGGKKPSKVDFQVSQNLNRMNNKLSGRRKHGAQQVTDDSVLSIVTCTDSTTHKMAACINGKLLEVNKDLLFAPELLCVHVRKKGFIGIILPYHNVVTDNFVTEEQYKSIREDNTSPSHE